MLDFIFFIFWNDINGVVNFFSHGAKKRLKFLVMAEKIIFGIFYNQSLNGAFIIYIKGKIIQELLKSRVLRNFYFCPIKTIQIGIVLSLPVIIFGSLRYISY